MAYMELTRGFITLIDDEWLEELNSYLWYASGLEGRPARRLTTNGRRLIYMYHQILRVNPWDLSAEGLCVDHINHDPLDNRQCNLRIVTIRENNYNRFKGHSGIGYDGTHNTYKAYLDMPDKKRFNIGTYRSRADAESALTKIKMELGLEDS